MMSRRVMPVSILLLLLATLLPLRAPSAPDKDAPVEIYYGLNGSHGNDWAQHAPDGSIGIAYFLLDDGVNPDHTGALHYRAVAADGSVAVEEVLATGSHLEKSVLLFEADGTPNVYLATSDELHQTITHYRRTAPATWTSQEVVDFQNEGGLYIYELSAALGPDGAHHLLVLKSRSNPDTADYYYAFLDAHLYHLTDASGDWERSLIKAYDTFYTLDEHAKICHRQDLAVDDDGFAHVVYGVQVDPLTNFSPCCARYATNRTGAWEEEVAVAYDTGTRDSAGWFASLALDGSGTPHVSCAYVRRLSSGSTISAHLRFYRRDAPGSWSYETVATTDDGYYGWDGAGRTGGLTHLVFDAQGDPHIAFTDLASSHDPRNVLNVGNVRHAVRTDGVWNLHTVHRQPPPNGYLHAEEMFGLCLLGGADAGRFDLIGQDLLVDGTTYESHLIHAVIGGSVPAPETPERLLRLEQNYPNPFNPATTIAFDLPEAGQVTIEIYDAAGTRVRTLVDEYRAAGTDSVRWNGLDDGGATLGSGTYVCRLTVNGQVESRKMLLLK